jgi:hypothetical protein
MSVQAVLDVSNGTDGDTLVISPSEPILLGAPPLKKPYQLKIPDNCTAKQLGIFLTGFPHSMEVGFAFTDQDYELIHPKIRGWFHAR